MILTISHHRCALCALTLLVGCAPSLKALDNAVANCSAGDADSCQAVPVLQSQVEIEQQQIQNSFNAIGAAMAAAGTVAAARHPPTVFYSAPSPQCVIVDTGTPGIAAIQC